MALRNSLLGHASTYALGIALQGAGALVVLPFVTRTLGPQEYGRVAVAVVVMTLVAMLASGGAQAVLLAEYFRDADGSGARAVAGAVVVAGVVLGGIAACAAAVLSSSAWQTVAISVVAAGGLALVSVEQALLRARQRPGLFVAVTVGSSVVAQLAGLLATQDEPTAEVYMTGYAATVWAVAIAGVIPSRTIAPWRRWPEVRGRGSLIAPMLPQSLALLALTIGDVALVALVLGDGQAGRYQVAWLLGSVAFYAASALANAWSPRAVENAVATHGWRYLRDTGGPALGAVSVVAVGVAGVSPLLLPILAPASFDTPDLVPVVAVVVVTGPASLLYLASVNVLLRQRRTPLVLVLTVLAAVSAAVVALVLMPSAGILGAGLGKVFGFAVLGLAATVAAQDTAGLLLRSWRVGRCSLALLAGCLAAAVGAGSDDILVRGGAAAAVLLAVSALLWPAASLAWRTRRASPLRTSSSGGIGVVEPVGDGFRGEAPLDRRGQNLGGSIGEGHAKVEQGCAEGLGGERLD